MTFNAGNALVFLVDAVFGLYIAVLLLRYILQVVQADFYNPLSQFVWQATNPPVIPLQRIIPRWKRHDFAALVIAYLLAAVNIRLDLALSGFGLDIPHLLLWALLKLIGLACNLYFFSILIQAIMSWVSPGMPTPAQAVLWSINEPLLRPVRNVLPPIAGLDLSPLVVLIALQMLVRLLPVPQLLM
jgi:YggT family protein